MKIKLLTEIAIALLLARWKQTLVAAIGVTFSITMFIALLGFMNGLNGLLDGLVLNRTPHIRLYQEAKPSPLQPITIARPDSGTYHFIRSVKSSGARMAIYNSLSIMEALRADTRVKGVAPKINAPVLYNNGTVDLTGSVSGIDVEEESRLFFFRDYVVRGNAMDLKNVSNSILLGIGLAEKLLVEPGDVVQVVTSKGDRLPLKVVGYFQSGMADLDKVQSFVALATAQKLLGESNQYITDLQLKLYDLKQAPPLAKNFRHLYGTDAVDIQTANAQFETGTSVRTLISYVVGIVLLIVAGFGIYNILNMMIYEKMDTIAILKATGFSGRDVQWIFLGIALSIGIAGGITGLLIGFGLSNIIDNIPFNTAALPTVKTYPVDYNPLYYIIGFTFAVLTTWFAGYLPSRKASKVDPVVIIRGK